MAVQLPDPGARKEAAEHALEEREQKRLHRHSVASLLEQTLRGQGSDLGNQLRNLAFRMANHPLKPNEISAEAKAQLSRDQSLLQTLAGEGVLSAAVLRELAPATPPTGAPPLGTVGEPLSCCGLCTR